MAWCLASGCNPGTFADYGAWRTSSARRLARAGRPRMSLPRAWDLVDWTGMRARARDDQLAVWAPGISLVSGRACLLPAGRVSHVGGHNGLAFERNVGRLRRGPFTAQPKGPVFRAVACAIVAYREWSPSSGCVRGGAADGKTSWRQGQQIPAEGPGALARPRGCTCCPAPGRSESRWSWSRTSPLWTIRADLTPGARLRSALRDCLGLLQTHARRTGPADLATGCCRTSIRAR